MAGRVRGRRLLWLTVIIVCLTLPLITEQFNFGFANNDDGDDDNANDNDNSDDIKSGGGGGGGGGGSSAATVAKKLSLKRPIEKKFKFHKIERVYVDNFVHDDNDDDDDVDGDNDGGEEEDNDDDEKQLQRENSANANDDDDDDQDDVSEVVSKPIRKSKSKSKTNKSKAKKRKRKGDDDADDDDDNTNNDDDDDDEQPSLFSRIMGIVFGGGGGGDDEERKKPKPSQSNSLIEWLQWLSERIKITSSAEEPEPEVSSSPSTSWLSYLDRWPFNSIFPGESKASHQSQQTHRSRHDHEGSDGGGGGGGGCSTEQQHQQQPLSQEYFELLMHSLPSFVVNASRVESGECRQQLLLLQRQLRVHKLWTLQMLDATGKIGAGLLRGNIHQLGDFELCTQLRTMVKANKEEPTRIRGKYCLAQIETRTRAIGLRAPLQLAHGGGLWHGHLGNPRHFAPRYTVANWGVCVPHSCSARVIRDMLQLNLRPYNDTTGVEFHIAVDDDDCVVVNRRHSFNKLMRKDNAFATTVLTIGVLITACVIALLWEQWHWITEQMQRLRQYCMKVETQPEPPVDSPKLEEVLDEENKEKEGAGEGEGEEEKPQQLLSNIAWNLAMQIVNAFSPQRTWRTLMEPMTDLNNLPPIIHLLRLGGNFMLYISLKYMMLGHLPIVNRDRLVATLSQNWSILFRAPLLYSDALLVVTGFLATYRLTTEMEQHSRLHWLRNVTRKATRHLAIVFVVIGFQSWVLPYLATGPLWQTLIGDQANRCGQQIWRNALSIQNAVNYDEACSPLTTQLALDVQLYLLVPLIVWLYHIDSEAGFFVYGALHAASVAMRFARAQNEHLAPVLFHGINVSKFYRTGNLIYASPLSRATPYLFGIGAGLLFRSDSSMLNGGDVVSPQMMKFGWLLSGLGLVWCFWSPATAMRNDFIYDSNSAAVYLAWSPLVLGLALCWCIFMLPSAETSSKLLRILCLSRPVLLLSRITFPLQLIGYVVVLTNTATVTEPTQFSLSSLINVSELIVIVTLALIVTMVVDLPSQYLRHLLLERIFVEQETSHVTTESQADTIWSSDPEEEERQYIERRRSSLTNPEATAAKNEHPEVEQIEDDEEEEEEEEDDA